MEAWLPEDWNGGMGGRDQYTDLEYTSALKFAAAATNIGHDSTSGVSFLNHPEVLEDFAYRTLHTGVVVGNKISTKFYDKRHIRSYYHGCLTDGRQR